MLRMGKGQEDFVNLCIAHRHQMCSGNVGYGCSIGILTQSYSAIASVPRPVRENCTLLCLFLNSDEKQRKKIKEELSDIPNLEDFEFSANERANVEEKNVKSSGWIGFTDHYWMTTLAPKQGGAFQTAAKYSAERDTYQTVSNNPS